MVVGRRAVRVQGLAANCPNGKKAGVMTGSVSTAVHDKRLAYLLKTGKMKGSALLHALSTFRPPMKKRVRVVKGGLASCASGRLTAIVKIMLARGYDLQGVAIRRLINVKHDPCANF